MNEMNNEGFSLGWDDEFTNEQQKFVLLPAMRAGPSCRPAPWQN